MMMTIYIVAGILVAIIFLAALGPKTFDVSRSITINKPVHEVFTYLTSVKSQNDWSPWKLKDPKMFQEYFGEDGTVGFKAYWKGNKEVGEGSQTITEIIENKHMYTRLVFLKPMKSECDGYYTFE
ncbi:MAG: SRPBCC family protein, partial [Dokdonia sp.]|nr:SRPBCC family protein [Dokdonia sp.]